MVPGGDGNGLMGLLKTSGQSFICVLVNLIINSFVHSYLSVVIYSAVHDPINLLTPSLVH